VFALGVAAFVGWEAAPVYAEEARTSAAVARATFGAVLFLGAFYMFSAWALALAVGPDHVVDAARDPAAGLPFSLLLGAYGSLVPALAGMLLVTSVIAAMLSFHSGVARYVYALGREQLLPPAFARLSQGVGGGSPVGGSMVQSVVAAIVIAVFALLGADPVMVVFTWLSTIGALGVLTLMVGCSLAALRFFKAGGGTWEKTFVRVTAPTLGILAGAAIVAIMVANMGSLLGVDPGSALTWIVPGLVVAAVLAGLCWGVLLRAHRPGVYAGIGRGRPHPLAVRDQRLSALKL
jgi:amino acid transporter